MPTIDFIVVVFPAPLCPIKPNTSPLFTSIDMFSIAFLFLYDLDKLIIFYIFNLPVFFIKLCLLYKNYNIYYEIVQ